MFCGLLCCNSMFPPVKSPNFLKILFPAFVWKVETREPELFLTFDDGPHPIITDYVLNLLKQFNVKATFFCVGDNVQKFPTTYQNIISQGHQTGNHTFNHLKGTKINSKEYVHNTLKAGELINSILFRPPYGRITKSQTKELSKHYKIIMWSLLTHDYRKGIQTNKVLNILKKKTSNGDIIVFHDSEKAFDNLKQILPAYLEWCIEQGFIFKKL